MKKKYSKVSYIIILAIVLFITIVPLYWMIVLSITPKNLLFKSVIPRVVTLKNYMSVLINQKVMLTYRNSWIIAGGVASISVLLGTLSGYGLSRCKFKFKDHYILFILITQMFPLTLLVIAYFQIASKIGFYNSILTLVLVDSTLTLPFVTMLMKSTFDSISPALEEVAMIDGCSRMGAFIRIALPLASPGLVAAGFFAFLKGWGEYLYGLTLTGDATARPITVELGIRLGHYATAWGEMMAISILMSVPIFIMFGIFQNNFLKGFTAGALKE